MNLSQAKILGLLLIVTVHFSYGLYIKSSHYKHTDFKNEWTDIQRKLGLSNEKVELLKSQKDQQGTLQLLNRFIKDNPEYETVNTKATNHASNSFINFYHNLVAQLKKSASTLKTSLNFELADDGSVKELKRPRRKIAVKMISDMPSGQIDSLLKVFNQQHGIDSSGAEADDYVDYDDGDDYMYEHLYEDEKDSAAPMKTSRNLDFGSIQDLILQAMRNHQQREAEETKLQSHNKHFL